MTTHGSQLLRKFLKEHDIQQVTAQVSAGSTQSLSATHDLTRLADELKRAIEGFQI